MRTMGFYLICAAVPALHHHGVLHRLLALGVQRRTKRDCRSDFWYLAWLCYNPARQKRVESQTGFYCGYRYSSPAGSEPRLMRDPGLDQIVGEHVAGGQEVVIFFPGRPWPRPGSSAPA